MAVINKRLFPMVDDDDDYVYDQYDHDDEYFHIYDQSSEHHYKIDHDLDHLTTITTLLLDQTHHHHIDHDTDDDITTTLDKQENPNSKTPPPSPRKPSKNSKLNTFSGFFLRLSMLMVGLILLMALVVPLMMEKPTPSFHIKSCSVTSFDVPFTSSKLFINWDIGFSTTNPTNATTFFYDNLEAAVYYGDKLLALTVVEPFYQQPEAKTFLRATFPKSEVTEDSAVEAIRREQTLDEPLAFNVKIQGRVKIDVGKSSSKSKYRLEVSCQDVYATVGSWWRSGLQWRTQTNF